MTSLAIEHGKQEAMHAEFLETQKQSEFDADREVLRLNVKNERKIVEEYEANLKMKGENGGLKKNIQMLMKEMEEKKVKIEKAESEQIRLIGYIR